MKSSAVKSTAVVFLLALALRAEAAFSSTNVPVNLNLGKTYQTMKGFGANITGIAWSNGALKPALDQLVAMGMTNARVVLDNNWEATESNPDPNVIDWTYYNALYSNADFTSLWNTIAYLNQKGLRGEAVTISAMGHVPTWMGTTQINTAFEDHWVRMVATMVYYARVTKGLDFTMLDPMNEPDWNGIEGPQVGSTQYTRLLNKLSVRLDGLGLSDVRFLGPCTASTGSGVGDYIPTLLGDPVVMAKLNHFGLHNYGGDTGGADAVIKSSAYPDRDFWMTEYASGADTTGVITNLQSVLDQGAAAALVWHGVDTLIPYRHNPDDNQGWGYLQEGPAGVFSARQSYFNAQPIYKAVPPGMVRFDVQETNGSLTTHGFTNSATGNVAITGYNTGSAITYVGTFTNGSTLNGVLQLYETTSSENYVRRADIIVSNGTFSAPISAGSVFELTGQLTAGGALAIATTSPLPDGSAGTPFSQTLIATGGTRPYAWSVSSGSLPVGLTLSSAGILNGTPSASGTFSFGVQVTDGVNATATKSFAMTISKPNLALSGTAFLWHSMANATANTNKVAAPGLNDNNLTGNIALSGGGDDIANAFEGGGIIWSSSQSFGKVVFMNGAFNASSYDGVFDSNFGLQTTSDGTTWTAVTGWSLSPAYAYNLPAAGSVSYVCTGPTLTAIGVRVVGEVHSLSGNDSWFDNCTEVQVFDSSTPTPPVITTQPANQSVAAGRTATFSVAATGTTPLSYQWQKNGININGATAASYTTPATTTADNGATFDVVVSNSVGSATSISATLAVTAPNNPPTVATPANASPNPVTATTTTLSVLGADDGGEANLIYTWTATGLPPATVTFSANGTNASKITTATFSKAGAYTLQVTIKDAGGLTATSSVNVMVNQTLTTIAVSPASATVSVGGTQQFAASAKDQFGNALTTQPAFAWTVSGGGTINSSGLYTATTAGGPFTVTAASNGISGTAGVTISSNTNIALSGTAYRWFALTSATANTNKTAAPGLNDNNLTADVALTGGGDDVANAFEAGGIIWSSSQSIAKVVFINGSFNAGTYDGVFDKSLALQSTTNGTTWTAVSGWSLAPAYPYNLASAANVSYSFTGPTLTALGIRVVGKVHSLSGNDSWYANCTEVQAFSTATAAMASMASGPMATPNPALVGQAVTLTAAASGSGQSLSWDFGDGNGGDGGSVSHTFTVPGTYSAAVTVGDDSGAANSAFVTVAVLATSPLKITKFQTQFHSTNPEKDACRISGVVTGLPSNLAGTSVSLTVGPSVTDFKLDSHGKGSASNALFVLKAGKFSAKVVSSALAAAGSATTLPVTLRIGDTAFASQVSVSQKSK